MPSPPASPQDDLDVPLSKLVCGSADDKTAETPCSSAVLLTTEAFVAGVCFSSVRAGKTPPPEMKEKQKEDC